jgi:SnoaL-like domain
VGKTTTDDRDEILQLLYRYNHTIDSGDAQGWADTFTDDGVFGPPTGQVVSGREALVDFASAVTGLRHVVVNPLVDIVDDAATVRAYHLGFQGTTLALFLSSLDEVVRTPSGWRFPKRVFTIIAGPGTAG